MKTIKLTNDFEISRIVHGHWRLADWSINKQELLKLTQQCIELGITTFDHADIYGNYSCEKLFGNALELKPSIRKDIQLITKCGIKLTTDKFPSRQLNHYDYSYNHIVSSVENSLNNFQTDYIDVLLLHRPSPFFNPEEVAKAFSYLKKSGKVLYFGVSNFTPQQFETLAAYTDEKLVTNQVEISPLCLEHFDNGNIDYLLQKNTKPMAWSPLAGGQLFNPSTEKEQRIFNTLTNIANELNIDSIDKLIYSWLLMHPATIIPVVGTHKIERIKNAVEALNIDMSLEQWFQIYTASTGAGVP